jgi:hypothetical protein
MIFETDGKVVNYSTFQMKQGGNNFKFTREWCGELPTQHNTTQRKQSIR